MKEEQKELFDTYFKDTKPIVKQDFYKIAGIWDDEDPETFNVVKHDPFLGFGAGVTVYFVL